jgi:hypothetical protein
MKFREVLLVDFLVKGERVKHNWLLNDTKIVEDDSKDDEQHVIPYISGLCKIGELSRVCHPY